MKNLIVAISGASGANLGLKLISNLPNNIKAHIIISNSAKIVLEKENSIIYDNSDISSSISSGSFDIDAMIVVPCSMNTLAKISIGISDDLISRSASVTLKEKRKLILAPREMPFDTIALENMHKLSSLGVIIAPPVIGYYSCQYTLEQMENFLIGKWFDLLKIKHNLYKRWV